jgi:type I restriction enzyme S subunit
VVMPNSIRDGRVDDSSISRISAETAEQLSVHRMQAGDIVLARRGDIGRRTLIDARTSGWVCGTGSLRISVPGGGLEPTYLYYFLGTEGAVGWLRGQAIGATMLNLNTDIIRRLEIPLPPLEIQRKIAATLAAYDELIENNLRRIEILEEMAQAVYREWFVNFRFPGHEDVPLVESEMGPIPAGWRATKVEDAHTLRLAKPQVAAYEGLRRYIATADCRAFHLISPGTTLPFSELPKRAQHQPVANSVWFGRMANYQKVMLFTLRTPELNEMVLSSGFACLRCNSPAWAAYATAWVLSDDFEDTKVQHATGTTQVALTDRGARELPLLEPEEEIVDRFGALVTPIYELAVVLRRQNEILGATRDLLLPKLVSGEIDVSELDIDTDRLASCATSTTSWS